MCTNNVDSQVFRTHHLPQSPLATQADQEREGQGFVVVADAEEEGGHLLFMCDVDGLNGVVSCVPSSLLKGEVVFLCHSNTPRAKSVRALLQNFSCLLTHPVHPLAVQHNRVMHGKRPQHAA